MQKATVFTLFFSILVLTLVAQLLTSNHLRDGWSSVIPRESLVATVPVTSAAPVTPVVPVAPVVPQVPLVSQIPATPSFTTAPKNTPSEVLNFLSERSYRLESVSPAQLQSFGFEKMYLERTSAEGLLFQIIDVSDVVNLSKIRFNMTNGTNVYGVMSEFLLADNGKAATFYEALKQKGGAFAPDIKLNETNLFGSGSFFLNDSKRVGTAFLTTLSGNRVFTFSYPKASHEFFKKLINLLAKQA